MQSSICDNNDSQIDHIENVSHRIHDLPALPDFTKRPKISPLSHDDQNDMNPSAGDSSLVRPSLCSHKTPSVSFFSDDINDEKTFNELPLNEILDDFEFDYEYDNDDNNNDVDDDDGSSSNIGNINNVDNNDNDDLIFNNTDNDIMVSTPSRSRTPDLLLYESIDPSSSSINRSNSPFPQPPKIEYTTEIPPFYDSTTLNYPYKSPLDYSDEEFDKMNHFEFLKELKFEEPPLLPVYLNSNLLNDSSNKNYKTFPYQYQNFKDLHVNEIYRYRINDLNMMDKYSAQKFNNNQLQRPTLNRSGSSNSSASSNFALKTIQSLRNPPYSTQTTPNKLLLRNKLTRENSSNSVKTNHSTKLKHSDKLNLIERNLIPHHVMLNHLITCNLNKGGYVTSSCITRYHGKFITQIVYFSNELEEL